MIGKLLHVDIVQRLFQKGVFTVRLIISRSCQSFFRIPLFSHTAFSVCLCERVNPSGMCLTQQFTNPTRRQIIDPAKPLFSFIHSSLLFLRPILFFNAHRRMMKKKDIFSNKEEEELPYLKLEKKAIGDAQ